MSQSQEIDCSWKKVLAFQPQKSICSKTRTFDLTSRFSVILVTEFENAISSKTRLSSKFL